MPLKSGKAAKSKAGFSYNVKAEMKVGIPGKYVNIDTQTYFIAKRMESIGMLRPGQALQLAATLPNKQPKKGRRK